MSHAYTAATILRRRVNAKHERELWELMTVRQKETYLQARATPSELQMKKLLDGHPKTVGRYRFQASVREFFADFLFPEEKLIVELDGSVHGTAKARLNDARRTKQLNLAGYKVIRFWNGQLRDPAIILWRVLTELGEEPGFTCVPKIEKNLAAASLTLDSLMINTRPRTRKGKTV